MDQPPASSVRRFLALLEQSDIDFSEELGKLHTCTCIIPALNNYPYSPYDCVCKLPLSLNLVHILYVKYEMCGSTTECASVQV